MDHDKIHTLTKNYTKDWSEDSIWIINTPSELAREAFFYVQEIGMFQCFSNYYTEHEGIASFLVMLTLAGESSYRYQNNIYRLRPGDLFFVDCMEYHSLRPHGSARWDMIWIQFNGIVAQSYYQQFLRQKTPVIHVGTMERVYHYLAELIQINQERSIYSELISSKLITELLTEILIQSGVAYPVKNSIPEYIQEAIKEIDTHFKDNLSLDYFAETLTISKFHFLKEFKKYTGFTPNNYLRMTRINHAKKLLRCTNMNVYEIAESAGFQTVGYFINTFKKIVGMTPLQFRQKHSL
ncbi:helix-turn-helix transcriptional regulator [Christensenella massiliensis]|uniref:AraC family transcriptional regulator n=1 Tax=Christensenella massiliensis TaxID=1805714 RepID=A0AAU8A6E5_9FIRM